MAGSSSSSAVKKFIAEQAFLRCLADAVDPHEQSAETYLDIPMLGDNHLLAAAIRAGKLILSPQSVGNILETGTGDGQITIVPPSAVAAIHASPTATPDNPASIVAAIAASPAAVADLIDQNPDVPALWYIQGSDAKDFHEAIFQALLTVAEDDAKLAAIVDALDEHKAKASVDLCLGAYPTTSYAIGRKA